MTAGALRHGRAEDSSAELFDRIRDFLLRQRLSPDPRHYHFAYRVMTETDGVLARSVKALSDGGFRLSSRDIEMLGGEAVAASAAIVTMPKAPAPPARQTAADAAASPDPALVVDGLVARTQMQVEGFTDMMHAIRAETQGFGRDLAASADAMRGSSGPSHIDEVARLTSVMLARVQVAESRLDAATSEARDLRTKLEEARENARRDPLTDLPNRRAFEEAFTLTAAKRPVHVALCDVDRFKSVNDRFGHPVGDRVLKAIGASLREACAGHLVARYGGEEFAILFVGVTRDAAVTTLEAARSDVAARRFRVRESNEQIGAVTFSAGMSAVVAGEDLALALGRADRLLYAAKGAGRNQVHAA